MHTDHDEAGIRRAATIYAIGADRRDKALWAQVLSDDCVIEGPGFKTHGLEANLANLDYLGQLYTRTQHRVHNQLFTIRGDRAIGETYGTVDHLREVDGRTELVAWSLRYWDELKRDGDVWLFTSRRLILEWEEIRPVGGSDVAVRDERITVAETVYQYATGIDTRNWAVYRSIFADEVEMDFESWNGIPRHTIRADDLVKNIRVYFAGLDGTQHSMSNPRVTIDGDRAHCVVYMQAEHFLDDKTPSRRFAIGGYYSNDLVRDGDEWKLTLVKLTVLWTHGDRSFMGDAFERGTARLERG
ncbi:nuclear transport factor 2 family protein [Burkholderia cenocepacia]|uniref:nuclear transport factor 2 family protein n=1 Tax=Burkholderia cenocepacia TaxID=95486 RepID=UPI001CF19CFB|nr:nuclear transport factor 2 family protein [Burkholderia cenocepacia]MCA8010209.1 nuclear transport factor 2 family protein [Burkholderia cenocepacia]